MREILFRGQTRKRGERVRIGDGAPLPGHWVFGGILPGKGDHSIIYAVDENGLFDDKYPVHSDTVGQYASKSDCNGFRIFEHDLLHIRTQNIDEEDGVFEVLWDNEGAKFVAVSNGLSVDLGELMDMQMKIVGNIHDNPELLEVATDDA